jgi:hypothetical protein
MSYNPPLVHLPGTNLTPEVVLHRTLNKKQYIKAVVIAIVWEDETVSLDWSTMNNGDMALAALALMQEVGYIVLRKDTPSKPGAG